MLYKGDFMPSGKTSNLSKAKYNAKAYDRIYVTVKKGMLDDVIRARADSLSLSVNAYINKLINDDLKK